MKRLKKKMATHMNNDETTKMNKADEELQKLNLAFNEINRNRDKLGQILNTAMAEDVFNRMGFEEEEFLIEETPQEPQRIAGIANRLEVKWKEKQYDTLEEIITFKDFVNGTKILLDDGDVLDVPPYFLGVIFNYKSDKFQFIKVKSKGSVVFIFNSNGNLILKTIPEGATLDKKGKLKFNYADKDFEFDLSKMKEKVEGSYRFVGEGQGVVTYGESVSGDLYIDVNNLTSKVKGLDEKVRNVLL